MLAGSGATAVVYHLDARHCLKLYHPLFKSSAAAEARSLELLAADDACPQLVRQVPVLCQSGSAIVTVDIDPAAEGAVCMERLRSADTGKFPISVLVRASLPWLLKFRIHVVCHLSHP